MPTSPRQDEIRAEFIRVHGSWSPDWQSILELDAEFLASYLAFSAVPRRRRALDVKVQEFLHIAIASAATYLHTPAIREHIRAALDLGATPAEIMEVIELTSGLGIHAMRSTMPILLHAMSEAGVTPKPSSTPDYRQNLKTAFTAARGHWDDSWNDIVEYDPEFFEAFTEFSSAPARTGTLDPKIREFIYISFDAAATHMYADGLRLHITRALALGATQHELIEVLEIASTIGIHGVTTAAPILAKELKSTAPNDRGIQ